MSVSLYKPRHRTNVPVDAPSVAWFDTFWRLASKRVDREVERDPFGLIAMFVVDCWNRVPVEVCHRVAHDTLGAMLRDA